MRAANWCQANKTSALITTAIVLFVYCPSYPFGLQIPLATYRPGHLDLSLVCSTAIHGCCNCQLPFLTSVPIRLSLLLLLLPVLSSTPRSYVRRRFSTM